MKSYRLFFSFIAVLLSLIVQSAAYANETTAAKVDQDYRHEMERLRLLAASNANQFETASKELKVEIENQMQLSSESASKSDRLADRYRSLATAAEKASQDRLKAAAQSETNAKEFGEGDSFRKLLLESAENDRKSAQEAKERAQSRRQLAAEWRGRAEAQRARIAALQAQIDALNRLANVPEPETSSAQTAEAPSLSAEDELDELFNPEDGAHPNFQVEDVLGLWRPQSGAQFPMAIVQKNPGDEAFGYELEIHTDSRVWDAQFTGFPAGDIGRSQNARIVATYTPQPAEMNPDIPDWVTAIIDGHLKWRLEIDETGSLFDPQLRVKWYRGEVRWTDGVERNAWIEGDGVPLVFNMEFEPLIDVTQGRAAVLWLEPIERRTRLQVGETRKETDYLTKRITELIKHQPFKIKVRLPIEMAKERGPKITVKIDGLKGRDSNELELIGPTVTRITTGSRGIVYTHQGEVTIADYGSEPTKNPQFMSLGYLAQNWTRSFEEGKRLNLSVANGEEVKFSYDGAAQSIHIWDTHIRHGLALHERALATHLAQADAVIRDSEKPADEIAAARIRWQLLRNYQTLFARDDLLDIHKFYLGELYLTRGIGGAHIVCKGDECQTLPLSKALFGLSLQDIKTISSLASVPEGEPAYFTDQIELYVEILTGKKKTPAALRVKNAVDWVDQGEADLVALALKGSSDQARTQFQNTVADMAYAIPKGLTEDVSILLYAKNLKNKPVSEADRKLTLTKFFVEYLMNKGAAFTSARVLRLRQQALSPVGTRSKTRSIIKGVPGVDVTPPTQVVRNVDAAPDVTVRQAAPDLPESVNPNQARQLSVKFDDDVPIDGEIQCRGPDNRYELGSLDDSVDAHRLMQEIYDQEAAVQPFRERELEIRRAYEGQPGVELEEIDVFGRQKGGTCTGASTAYAMREIFGDRIDLDYVINGIADSIQTTNENQIRRARARYTERQQQLLEANERNIPAEEAIYQRDVALEQLKRVQKYQERAADVSKAALEDKVRFLEEGSIKSYHAVEAVLREGGRASVLRPIDSMRLKLRHLRTLKKRNYQVVVVINRGERVDHAIAITKFEMKDGNIHRVYWFDSSHDVILSAPAKTFDNMIARRAPLTRGVEPVSGARTTTVAQPIVFAYRGPRESQ